jgi:hypothetical protein
MLGQSPPMDPVATPTNGVLPAVRTAHPASVELPGWESFPAPDRQLLITLLVQTARRQVGGPPINRRGMGSE